MYLSQQGMVVHACNTRTQEEVEAEGQVRSSQLLWQVESGMSLGRSFPLYSSYCFSSLNLPNLVTEEEIHKRLIRVAQYMWLNSPLGDIPVDLYKKALIGLQHRWTLELHSFQQLLRKDIFSKN